MNRLEWLDKQISIQTEAWVFCDGSNKGYLCM